MGRDPKSPRAQPSRERAVSDCTFYVNEADNEGGGIYNQESAPVLTNCIFWENTRGGFLLLSCRPKAESPAFPSFQTDVNHKDDIQFTKSFPEPVNVQYGRVL